ncbi:GIY-YIG nuclease family protein [Porphyromonas gingivalis]|uniref:GIY-YIG nuclease family protein n=1 Tax=Porphyromonas gingivalis TaxID=837 RepID=UPI0030C75BA9
MSERNHNILYFGIAINLKQRLMQELFAKGHGTFFRSLGALLGHRPEKGSLVGKKNQKNYRFPKRDEQKIAKWIIDNLAVNWIELEEDVRPFIEKYLIEKTSTPT